jgi:hypothetical protein
MLYLAIAGCFVCDYFKFLESLNLGYNKKSLWSLLVSVGELEWQNLRPKEKNSCYKLQVKT